MKPTAAVINTARGPIIDEAALIEALRDGAIAGAGLDVLEQEPPSPNNPLLTMENVLVTPHVASATPHAAGDAAAGGPRGGLVLRGRWPMSCVNPTVLPRVALERWQPYPDEQGPEPMNVATAIAKAMKAEGVDILFAYPVNPLIEAAAEEDIRTVIVRQERTGLHMADAYSRVSSGDKIGVFCMQHGPGAENAFGGVAQAFSESVPILVIPAGYPRRLAHYYPELQLHPEHAAHHQVGRAADHGPRAPGGDAAGLLPAAQRPARSSVGRSPGRRVRNEEVPDDLVHTPSFTRPQRAGPRCRRRCGAGAGGRGAARDLRRPGRPLRQGLGELRTLAEAWNIPVTTSIEGKSAFPENHPLSLGQRRPGQSAAGQDIPGRRRRDPRGGLQLRADRLRRADAARQDHHPRHARSDGPQQGRGRCSTA